MTLGIASNEEIFTNAWIDRRQFVAGEGRDTLKWLLRNYKPWKERILELWKEMGAPAEIAADQFTYMRSQLAAMIAGSDEDTRTKTALIPELVLEHLLQVNRFKRNRAGNFESQKTEAEIAAMKKEKIVAETKKIEQEIEDVREAGAKERERLEEDLKIERARAEITKDEIDRVQKGHLANQTKLQDELRKEDVERTKAAAKKGKKNVTRKSVG